MSSLESMKFENPEILTNTEYKNLWKLKNNPDLAKKFMARDDLKESLEKEIAGYLKRKNTINDDHVYKMYCDILKFVYGDKVQPATKEQLGSDQYWEAYNRHKGQKQRHNDVEMQSPEKGIQQGTNSPSTGNNIPNEQTQSQKPTDKPTESVTKPQGQVESSFPGADAQTRFKDTNLSSAVSTLKIHYQNPNAPLLGDNKKAWKDEGYHVAGWSFDPDEIKQLAELEDGYRKNVLKKSNENSVNNKETHSSKTTSKSEKSHESVENGPNKKYVDEIMKLGLQRKENGRYITISREEMSAQVDVIRKYYDKMPGFSQKFSFGDTLSLVIVESSFDPNEKSSAGCHGLFQIGNEAVGDMLAPHRSQFYNKKNWGNLQNKPGSVSAWTSRNDNPILGLTNIDGLFNGAILDKYVLPKSSFTEKGIRTKSGKLYSKNYFRKIVEITAENKNSHFDNDVFDRVYHKVLTDENYRNKFNILYQYNSGIKYPFSVLYFSEKLFGGLNNSPVSAEKTMPKQNPVPEMPASKPESQPKSGTDKGNESRESREKIKPEEVCFIGDSLTEGYVGGTGLDNINGGKNLFKSSMSTKWMLDNFEKIMARRNPKPKRIIMLGGMNDGIYAGEGLNGAISNLKKIEAIARNKYGIKEFLVGTYPTKEEGVIAFNKTVIETRGSPNVVDFDAGVKTQLKPGEEITKYQKYEKLWGGKKAYVHMTKDGYEKMKMVADSYLS